jgi:CheY-like chemotaxis protein/anti-sigma regulatory factor (Ser/Thr protein kinase)
MNAIIGLSDLALKTPLDAKQRDYISKVHRAGTSLLAVVNDILDFSKIEAGRLELEALDFAMDEVVGAVATVTAQKAHEKGLEFLTRVSPAVPARLRGDPLRLGQILTNLVDNALKFTERGQVQLTVEVLDQNSEKAQIQCSVRDTGIGVTREQAAGLFQPFTQANMSTTRTHGGTGLGLSIARRLVEAMSGEIRLDSQPGVGSTFSFTVWLGVGAPTDLPGAIVPAAVRAGRLRGARILVTEDNEINQQIAIELLEGAGAKVEIASNGRVAIEAVANASPPYDLVLMDLQMPEMDGYQATARIRSDTRFTDLPIIAMTAHATLEERERCLDAGMNDHVSKPIDPEALFETLGRYYVPSEIRNVGEAPTAPSRAASTEEHSSEEAGLPSVEGLDTFDGLRGVAGNRALYLTLLRKFIDEQSNVPARIAACLTTGDHDGAERLAHTLKGLAGSLGAGAVGAASAALEESIASHGDASRIERLRGRLADMLTELHDALGRALAPRPTATAGAPADPESIKTLVAWMRTQLRELDPGAVDLLESHRDAFASVFSRTALTAFERHVQTYAFDAADTMLTQAIEAAAPDVRVSS